MARTNTAWIFFFALRECGSEQGGSGRGQRVKDHPTEMVSELRMASVTSASAGAWLISDEQ